MGGIYGPIPFARAASIAHEEMRRVHISGLLVRSWVCSSGPDGICASSPNQVNGLPTAALPPQVLKKLISATCAIFGGSSISVKSIQKSVAGSGGKVGNAK